jgi:hypothetical protein
VPFTAAHPAAVLPLWPLRRRLHLDTTCLVTGSIAPDFGYFVEGDRLRTFCHTLVGLAAWAVPVALVLAWLFHALVKRPLVLVAPAAIARRVLPEARASWPVRWSFATLASCVAAAAIGAATHLAWDNFTHAHTWGVKHFAWLNRGMTVPLLGRTARFHVLQYVCSILGFAIVIWFVVRALRRRAAAETPPPTDWLARAVYALAIAAAVAATWYARGPSTPPDFESRTAVTMAGLLPGIVVASLVLVLRARRSVDAGDSPRPGDLVDRVQQQL